MIVADSNLIAYLLIPGEKSLLAEAILQKDPDWIVPLLWRSELRNILTLYMRQQILSLAEARRTIEKAESFLNHKEFLIPSSEVLDLTSKHKISAYDAEFIVLARQFNIRLLTFDKPLRNAFPTITVNPDAFI